MGDVEKAEKNIRCFSAFVYTEVLGMWILASIMVVLIGILVYKASRRRISFDVSPTREDKKRWQQEDKEWRQQENKEIRQVKRNNEGIHFEKKGHIDKARALYEVNIAENFEGSHPYDRLAIIYRKRNQIDDEIRVLEKAVWVFENILNKKRQDSLPKLDRIKKRLQKAQKMRLSS